MSASERRSRVRSAAVWETLEGLLKDRESCDVLDIGGGTGGSAVRIAEWGHRVTVVDPSPDALAALARRADEQGVMVTGIQGEVSSLLENPGEQSADVVLCHGVLEVAGDPQQTLTTVRRVLRPSGALSLLFAQRHAAVVARAVGGHFTQALELLDGSNPQTAKGGRVLQRFTHEESLGLLTAAGFAPGEVRGVQVFSDLVPGALVDTEPGAAAALSELESRVSVLPEYFALATQLHILAHG